MKLMIRDTDPVIVKAFMTMGFEDVANAHICLGFADALITAGNSYGIMNGGVDLSVRSHFGVELQDRIQWEIVRSYRGFLPVGCAIWVGTGRKDIPAVIYAPTMSVPMIVKDSRNAYSAFRAALLVAEKLDSKTVVTPALCTASGMMDPMESARQMMEAYKEICHP